MSLGPDLDDPLSLQGLHPAKIVITRFNRDQMETIEEILDSQGVQPSNTESNWIARLNQWVTGFEVEHNPLAKFSRRRAQLRVRTDLLFRIFSNVPKVG